MIGNDALTRFAFRGIPVRGAIVQLGPTWNAVRTRNPEAASIQHVLGEACAAAALMFSNIKLEGQISLQLQGSGPLRLLLAQCSSEGTLRAIARPAETSNAEAMGFRELTQGATLAITIERKSAGGQRYQGIVPLEGDSLGEALEGYFEQSEQLPSRIWLMADGQAAAGLLLQRLPGDLEDPDDWNRVTQLSETITPGEMLALPALDVLHRLFHREQVEVFPQLAVNFSCPCSRERVKNVLRSLDQAEIEAAAREQGDLEVSCEFCNEQYRFDAVDPLDPRGRAGPRGVGLVWGLDLGEPRPSCVGNRVE
ncbi:MAG: Hsp33 family molecular chaperone HslO, partial [Pseudomonadota bacterium]